MQQLIRKRQVAKQITVVILAEAVQGGKDFTKPPFKARMKRSAGFLRNGHIDEPPVSIYWGIPSAVGLIDADPDEQSLHFASPGGPVSCGRKPKLTCRRW